MTYRELIAALYSGKRDNILSLDDEVTIHFREIDEFYPARTLRINVGDDVLHNGHLYLEV